MKRFFRWLRTPGSLTTLGTIIPIHVHEWKAPDSNLGSNAGITFTLLGQVCDCGARRVYNGPMRGFSTVENSHQMQKAVTKDLKERK